MENKSGVEVNDGYFTVRLDFGDPTFEGDARYLEIEVVCGAASTLLVGASQLVGPINNDGGGVFTCTASYDGSYTALNTDCQ